MRTRQCRWSDDLQSREMAQDSRCPGPPERGRCLRERFLPKSAASPTTEKKTAMIKPRTTVAGSKYHNPPCGATRSRNARRRRRRTAGDDDRNRARWRHAPNGIRHGRLTRKRSRVEGALFSTQRNPNAGPDSTAHHDAPCDNGRDNPRPPSLPRRVPRRRSSEPSRGKRFLDYSVGESAALVVRLAPVLLAAIFGRSRRLPMALHRRARVGWDGCLWTGIVVFRGRGEKEGDVEGSWGGRGPRHGGVGVAGEWVGNSGAEPLGRRVGRGVWRVRRRIRSNRRGGVSALACDDGRGEFVGGCRRTRGRN